MDKANADHNKKLPLVRLISGFCASSPSIRQFSGAAPYLSPWYIHVAYDLNIFNFFFLLKENGEAV